MVENLWLEVVQSGALVGGRLEFFANSNKDHCRHIIGGATIVGDMVRLEIAEQHLMLRAESAHTLVAGTTVHEVPLKALLCKWDVGNNHHYWFVHGAHSYTLYPPAQASAK